MRKIHLQTGGRHFPWATPKELFHLHCSVVCVVGGGGGEGGGRERRGRDKVMWYVYVWRARDESCSH